MSSILWRCRRFCTSTEQWISRLCKGDGGSYFMKGLWEFLKHVTAAVIAAILKETLTLKSSDEIDTVVRNPDTGSTSVRMNLENANRSLGRPRVQECGDARAWRSWRGGSSEVKCLQQVVFATCPLRRRMKRPWTTLAFRPRGWIVGWLKHVPNGREGIKTAREGTREPVKRNSQGPGPQNPWTKERAVPTAGEQHAEKRVEANDKVWEMNLNVSAQDKSNVIINMNRGREFPRWEWGRSVEDRDRMECARYLCLVLWRIEQAWQQGIE